MFAQTRITLSTTHEVKARRFSYAFVRNRPWKNRTPDIGFGDQGFTTKLTTHN